MVTLKGKKLNMSQVFDESGNVVPVTLVQLDKDSLLEGVEAGAKIQKLTGTSKGKGFSGVMKRWGFAGGPATHGQSDRKRAPGSIGGSTHVGRVFKGKKMAGRMGGDRVTIKSSVVMVVDKEKKTISVSGPVPGHRGSKVELYV